LALQTSTFAWPTYMWEHLTWTLKEDHSNFVSVMS